MRAELLRARGQLAAAIDAYRAALAGSDDDAYMLARLGSALDEAGEHEQAQRVLQEALEHDPACEAAWIARAGLFERAGATQEALDSLQRAAIAAPTSARAPLLLSKLLAKHGQPERARDVLAQYRAHASGAGVDVHRVALDEALLEGDPDKVFQATLPYRMGAAARAVDRLNRAAQLLLSHQKAALALRVIELLPAEQREPALELRILAAVGSRAQIEAWLVTHEPSRPDSRIRAARSALLVNRLARASAILDADRLLRPDTPSLQLLGAEIAAARGEYLKAADQFARVPSSSSVGPDAERGLALALRAFGLEALATEVEAGPPQAGASASPAQLEPARGEQE